MAKNRAVDDLASEARRRFPEVVAFWRWLCSGRNDRRRTAFIWAGSLLIIYLLLVPQPFSYHTEFVVKGAKHEAVWEYVGDFSNMPTLNPTVEHWTLLEESGNFDDWRYRVKYDEHLHTFPSIKSTAEADIQVMSPPVADPLERQHSHDKYKNNGTFVIKSNHLTCFRSVFCVSTKSEFRFSPVEGAEEDQPATKCEEDIRTSCLLLLFPLCSREIRYQRESIQEGISKHFSP